MTLIDKRQPRVSISADSMGNLIAVEAHIAKSMPEEREHAMATARTLYAIMLANGVKTTFEWADPDFKWPGKGYCELKSVTIAGKRFEV